MELKQLNLFIVNNDPILISTLKVYLEDQYKNSLKISTFTDWESCLTAVSEDTDIVILDYILKNKNVGLKVLQAIKKINPMTEVIMFSSNQDVALAIDSIRLGAKDSIVKGRKGSLHKIISIVAIIVQAPIRILVKEFGVSKYLAIFLMIFFTMCLIVLIVMKIFS
jgi:DNA-binding NtrC family response regulator